jgi:hypothetical protein
LTIWSATWSEPFLHPRDLLGSLSKELIETLLFAELIAPPTVTDETEPTIAGVTSLHEFPRGLAEGGLVTMSRHNGRAGNWCLWKSPRPLPCAMSRRVTMSQSRTVPPGTGIDPGRLASNARRVDQQTGRKREALMTSSKERAAEFRRQGFACIEVAKRMSLEEDRERMIETAEHWFQLARRAETETEEPSE